MGLSVPDLVLTSLNPIHLFFYGTKLSNLIVKSKTLFIYFLIDLWQSTATSVYVTKICAICLLIKYDVFKELLSN